LSPGKEPPELIGTGGWVWPRNGPNAVEKKTFLRLELIEVTLSWPVVSAAANKKLAYCRLNIN
jgi:hypothetical protein